MIAYLTGVLIEQQLNHVILDVHGVGYEVNVPAGTQGRLQPKDDGRVSLHVYTNVREDTFQLFGFGTRDEKRTFEKLTSVSGVGPKLALSIISALPPTDLIAAVEANNLTALTNISGIGKKTAQRLILELKSKFDNFLLDAISPTARAEHQAVEDLKSALGNLGYKEAAIEPVLDILGSKAKEGVDINELLREALKLLRTPT